MLIPEQRPELTVNGSPSRTRSSPSNHGVRSASGRVRASQRPLTPPRRRVDDVDMMELVRTQRGNIALQGLHEDLATVVRTCFEIVEYELYNSDAYPDRHRFKKTAFIRKCMLKAAKICKCPDIQERLEKDPNWTRQLITLVGVY